MSDNIIPFTRPRPQQTKQRDPRSAIAHELYPRELDLLLAHQTLKILSRREAKKWRAMAWARAWDRAHERLHAREQQSCQQENQMAALDGRPVQTKQEFAAEQKVQKAARKAERGEATKQKALSQNISPDKEEILAQVRELGTKDGIDPSDLEKFISQKSQYPAPTLHKHLLTWFAEWKLGRNRVPSTNLDDDYPEAWAELGAGTIDTAKWSSEAIASARSAAKSYRRLPGMDWTQVRAIVAALGTCAWLAHIAHLDGDVIQVLSHDWQESAAPCNDSWAAYVAKDLSRIIGRTITGFPCNEGQVGYNRRTCR
jgi:hypothetical protein